MYFRRREVYRNQQQVKVGSAYGGEGAHIAETFKKFKDEKK